MHVLRYFAVYDNISIPLSTRIRSTSTSANSLIRLAACVSFSLLLLLIPSILRIEQDSFVYHRFSRNALSSGGSKK